MKEYNVGKYAPFSLCIILSVMYFLDLPVNMWTFHFSHANVFHLCGNLIAISAILKGTDYRYLPLAFLTSSLEWTMTDGNAVGFSAIVYYMWGTRIIRDFITISAMGERAKMQASMYAGGIVFVFLLSAIVPNVSFSLHFFPFVSGVVLSGMIYIWRSFKLDTQV